MDGGSLASSIAIALCEPRGFDYWEFTPRSRLGSDV